MTYKIKGYGKYLITNKDVVLNARTLKEVSPTKNGTYSIYNDEMKLVRISIEEINERSHKAIDCQRRPLPLGYIEVDARGGLWSVEFPSRKIEERFKYEGILEWARCFHPTKNYHYNECILFAREGFIRLSKNQVRIINPSIYKPQMIIAFSDMYIKSIGFDDVANEVPIVTNVITGHMVETTWMIPDRKYTNSLITTEEVKHFNLPINGNNYWIPLDKLDLGYKDMLELISLN